MEWLSASLFSDSATKRPSKDQADNEQLLRSNKVPHHYGLWRGKRLEI